MVKLSPLENQGVGNVVVSILAFLFVWPCSCAHMNIYTDYFLNAILQDGEVVKGLYDGHMRDLLKKIVIW